MSYRSKKGNVLGKKTYEAFLLINGFGGTVLLGVAVATFFTGSDFVVNKDSLTNLADPVISRWLNPLGGLEALLNVRNLMLGLAVFFLSRVTASLYFINCIQDEAINARSRKQVFVNIVPFLAFFLGFVIWTFAGKGFAVHPETQQVYRLPAKYFINLLEMPAVLTLFLSGVLSLLYGVVRTLLKPDYRKGVWFTGAGVVAAVLALFLIVGLHNTSYYPSNTDLQSSLTICNSSSSFFTLKVMSIVSLIIPFVALYIFQAWRAINRKPIDQEEMRSGDHQY
jgi:Cytochrome bd-type quinol oxidase, subunit 2